jgi:membrane associated rhomboid family serine protease
MRPTLVQALTDPDVPRKRIGRSAILPALTVLVLWLVYLLDKGLGLELYRWGVLPRSFEGIPGILFSPFIHGDLEHLFNNSVPMFLLGWSLIYFYPRKAGVVVLVSWLVSGIWVWISARGNYHIGASGVVYGLAAFLFVSGLLRRQRTLMALSMLVVFLYGSMVWGIFPIVPRISWESHLWGGVAGVLMAYLYRKVPPAVQDPPPPVFEDEDEEEGMTSHDSMPPPLIPSPLRIVYHLDPRDEIVDDADPAKAADHAEGGQPFDPDRTSGTWSTGKGPAN